ncbi:MAG: hypothetical protein VB078_00465 [Clostridiaceae bacterium]|nr:hypothetical protein [Clostridiaceae bacterium]
MTAITISDGTTTVTMPQTDQVSDAGAMEYKALTMAGGREVHRITGFRPGFTYAYDYAPATTVRALAALLRAGTFFTVGYFDLDGEDKSGTFSITYPLPKVFKYDENGVAVWHDFSLTIKAQEVI